MNSRYLLLNKKGKHKKRFSMWNKKEIKRRTTGRSYHMTQLRSTCYTTIAKTLWNCKDRFSSNLERSYQMTQLRSTCYTTIAKTLSKIAKTDLVQIWKAVMTTRMLKFDELDQNTVHAIRKAPKTGPVMLSQVQGKKAEIFTRRVVLQQSPTARCDWYGTRKC